MKATLLGGLILATSVSLAAAEVAVDRGILRKTFEGISSSDTRHAQQMMQDAGLYRGAIDGIYGRGTETAVIQTAEFLEDNSRGRLDFNLDTRDGVAAFLNFLRSDRAAAWLWGEGEECDC